MEVKKINFPKLLDKNLKTPIGTGSSKRLYDVTTTSIRRCLDVPYRPSTV